MNHDRLASARSQPAGFEYGSSRYDWYRHAAATAIIHRSGQEILFERAELPFGPRPSGPKLPAFGAPGNPGFTTPLLSVFPPMLPPVLSLVLPPVLPLGACPLLPPWLLSVGTDPVEEKLVGGRMAASRTA